MKLALVIPGFQANEQDWCIPAFTNLARELAESCELHVFTLRYPSQKRRYRIGRVHIHAIGGGAMRERRLPGVSLLNLWRNALLYIEHEHRRAPFDAVIGIWATESGWLATRAARRLGVPSLVHIAGGELAWIPQIGYGNWGRGLAGRLVKRTLADATILSVPSAPLGSALLGKGRANPQKVREWPLGVDTRMFRPGEGAQPNKERPFTFITVGSLIPVKGHEWLLAGLSHLRHHNPECEVQLEIVGAGPLQTHLQEVVRRENVEGYVTFLGEAPHHELPALMRGADAFLLGSWHEAQCMAALEALACGLPWVGPPVGALHDLSTLSTKGKPTGITVEERTREALAEAMLKMASLAAEERAQWGGKARRRVVEGYDLQTQTARLLALIAGM